VDRAGTNVLIRFQPLASNFRSVLATIKLSSHLENNSDQAVNIARRVRALIQKSELEQDKELLQIFEMVNASLAEALEAFAAFDNTRAAKLGEQMEALAEMRGSRFCANERFRARREKKMARILSSPCHSPIHDPKTGYPVRMTFS
jgi:Na+/phosphate symporter